jgi:signal transduction histidine kinase
VWLPRIGALAAAAFLVTGIVAASGGRAGRGYGVLVAVAVAAAPIVHIFARRAARAGLVAALVLAAGLAGAACVQVFGTSLGLAAAVLAPFVVAGAAALGPTAAFLLADGILLVWAGTLGLSAGGLYPIGPGLVFGSEQPLLELGVLALVLNAVALACAWAIREADPGLHEEFETLRVERRRLISELESAHSLTLTGRLVANVAHEISNPVQAMDNFIFVLLEETPEEDPRHPNLVMLKQGIERITQYLDQLSDFYRPVEETTSANLNRTVGDVFRFLERQLQNANVKVRQEVESDLPRARIAEEKLRQVVLNVVLNAVEAMPTGGELCVSTGRDGEALVAAFQDSGPGISDQDLERIFEPFFTTKAEHCGTGLGLSISQRILRSHGGDMRAESSPGHGTRLILGIPAADPET